MAESAEPPNECTVSDNLAEVIVIEELDGETGAGETSSNPIEISSDSDSLVFVAMERKRSQDNNVLTSSPKRRKFDLPAYLTPTKGRNHPCRDTLNPKRGSLSHNPTLSPCVDTNSHTTDTSDSANSHPLAPNSAATSSSTPAPRNGLKLDPISTPSQLTELGLPKPKAVIKSSTIDTHHQSTSQPSNSTTHSSGSTHISKSKLKKDKSTPISPRLSLKSKNKLGFQLSPRPAVVPFISNLVKKEPGSLQGGSVLPVGVGTSPDFARKLHALTLSSPKNSVPMDVSFTASKSMGDSSTLSSYAHIQCTSLTASSDSVLSPARPLDKFVQGALENYIESGGCVNLYNLQRTLEVLHGRFVPSKFLASVLTAVQNSSEEDFILGMDKLLSQDVAKRNETKLKPDFIWRVLEKSMDDLKNGCTGGSVPLLSNAKVLAAWVLLRYLKEFFGRDLCLMTVDREERKPLIEQVLSLKKRWARVMKVLDFLFVVLESSEVSIERLDLFHTTLELLCLPLLSFRVTERNELITKLAREISTKISAVRSVAKKTQFLKALPSHFLREKVVDFQLELEFKLTSSPNPSQSVCNESSVSIAKIGQVHFCRMPYHPNGSAHDLSYFLTLLVLMLQSHIQTLKGASVYSTTATRSHLLSAPQLTPPSSTEGEGLNQALRDIKPQVSQLSERLSHDELIGIELTLPANWFMLQLLNTLTGF